jgi:hypothetical protein
MEQKGEAFQALLLACVLIAPVFLLGYCLHDRWEEGTLFRQLKAAAEERR